MLAVRLFHYLHIIRHLRRVMNRNQLPSRKVQDGHKLQCFFLLHVSPRRIDLIPEIGERLSFYRRYRRKCGQRSGNNPQFLLVSDIPPRDQESGNRFQIKNEEYNKKRGCCALGGQARRRKPEDAPISHGIRYILSAFADWVVRAWEPTSPSQHPLSAYRDPSAGPSIRP